MLRHGSLLQPIVKSKSGWLYNGPTNSKFSFTTVKMIWQVCVRSARVEVVGRPLPFKSTFVVNTNGNFAVRATEGGQSVF